MGINKTINTTGRTVKNNNLEKIEQSSDITKLNNSTNLDLSKYTDEQIEIAKTKTTLINANDRNSILNFGLELQQNLSKTSDKFLSNVRGFDVGEIGDSITNLLSEINQIDINPERKSVWQRMLMKIPGMKGIVMNVKKVFQKYDTVAQNVENIVTKLNNGRLEITKDNVRLEDMFNNNVKNIEELEQLLLIGNLKIVEEQELLFEMQKNIDNYEDYEISDKAEFISRLEKRIHDMTITRIITLQSLPQIRLVQSNNYVMAEKTQSIITSTIPVWKQQIGLAIAIIRQSKGAEIIKRITDTTNEMIMKNAEKLHQNTIIIAKQNERGIIDMETLNKVQTELIATLDDLQKIKEEGKQTRIEAQKTMIQLENNLIDTISKVNKVSENTIKGTQLKSLTV